MDRPIENIPNYHGGCLVHIRNLCKRYGTGPPILHNLSMNVDRGTIYGLLGASGCGKTTVMSSIVGLTGWDSGELLVFGKRPCSPNRVISGNKLGYMPQVYNNTELQRNCIVSGAVDSRNYSILWKDLQYDIGEIMERLGVLNKLLDLPDNCRQIGGLSGGQKRRASMALALIHSPELLVLDEPTVGLDPLLRVKIWEYLHEIVRTFVVTIIISTHYVEETRFTNMIGVLRNGRMLVEDTPSRLLQLYQCELLEQVILQLCRNDEATLKIKTKDTDDGADNHFESREIEIFTSKWHEIAIGSHCEAGLNSSQVEARNERNREFRNGIFAAAYHNLRRVFGMTSVILIVLMRHPLFLVALLILPTWNATISILILGTKPKGKEIGVVNYEAANWTTECALPRYSGEYCDISILSCTFLNLLATGNIVTLESYHTEEDALAQVHRGNSMGYMVIPGNYSQHTVELGITKQLANNETLEGSRIHLRLDNSQYLAAVFSIKHMMLTYIEYIQVLASLCYLGGPETELPLQFREPVYGDNDDNYVAYILPGVVLSVLIGVSSTLTAIMLIADRNQKTMSRTLVAGLTPSILTISHLIAQGIITVLQTVILGGVLSFIFRVPVMGPLWICLAICLLTGLCGTMSGILLGIYCHNEVEAIGTEIFVIPFILVFGGVLWPTENLPKVWRYIGYFLPTSLSTESLRSVIVRGMGITHPLVWSGLLLPLIWILVLAICCAVAYRIFHK